MVDKTELALLKTQIAQAAVDWVALEAKIEALEADEPEHKFYVGQPCLFSGYVTGRGTTFESTAHFKEYAGERYLSENDVEWDNCVPDPEAPSLPNWILNTGVEPDLDMKYVLCELRGGGRFFGDNIVDWSIDDDAGDVIRYCYLPPLEFL